MPISYSHPTSDADIYAAQAKTTRAQLAEVIRELDAVLAQRESDPNGWEWKAKFGPLTRLKSALERQLQAQERNAGSRDNGPRALTSGSYWLGPDH
jgi:hypothetical protein